MNTQTGVPELATLPADAFRRLVDDDLKGKAEPALSAALRLPANVDRWFSVLLSMSKSVEGQLAARKDDWTNTRTRMQGIVRDAPNADERLQAQQQLEQEKSNYLRWRAGTIRFKTGLDEWLTEARHLRDSSRDDMYQRVTEDERHRLASRLRKLEDGIKRHRERILADVENDDEHDDADEELWGLLP